MNHLGGGSEGIWNICANVFIETFSVKGELSD